MILIGKLVRYSGFRVGGWRWPAVVGLPLAAGGVLFAMGIFRPHYQGTALLAYSGDVKGFDAEPASFKSRRETKMTLEKVPGQPLQLSLKAGGAGTDEVVQSLRSVGQAWAEQSLARQRTVLKKTQEVLQNQVVELKEHFEQLLQSRPALLAGSQRYFPRVNNVPKIEELKSRRRGLIARYPSHTDIPLLTNQIQDLINQQQQAARPAPLAERVIEWDRRINETKVRLDYFSRRLQESVQAEKALKPSWRIVGAIQKPKWPHHLEGWPLGAGVVCGVFILGFLLFKGERSLSKEAASDGLWKPEIPESPVLLQVVSPEPSMEMARVEPPSVPTDPLIEKAAVLYSKWVEVAHRLYEPAAEPPQGILDRVGPLLRESSEFLSEGHEVMPKYLARCVTAGDLAAHVARTVLMTLTGAQEAGVSPEHRRAMALAALFHDLAVVPRPAGLQDAVGSEVGRLSATVLRRIPGLEPAILAMVEDILIGMDEFKLDTWQNAVNGNTLEPLSKVLREIDRFEKVMQKQKSRLDRRVANQ